MSRHHFAIQSRRERVKKGISNRKLRKNLRIIRAAFNSRDLGNAQGFEEQGRHLSRFVKAGTEGSPGRSDGSRLSRYLGGHPAPGEMHDAVDRLLDMTDKYREFWEGMHRAIPSR